MSDDKKLKRKQKKFFKTADQISKNQDKRRAGKNVNKNQQDRKFKKLDKTANQVSKLKKEKASSAHEMVHSPLTKKLTASCKAAAKRKFKVYPSAYANMWASKQQKKGKC